MILRPGCVILILLSLGACVVRQHAVVQIADTNPRFEWFEYSGNDAVYEMHVPGPEEYTNPLLPGFYPDPSIVRVEDDFYLVTSSFAYYPGIPLFHSRDLVHWTQLGHILDRPSQLTLDGLRISRGVFAPTIRYHQGTFYVICTLVDAGGNFLVTATDPSGPWSDPVWLGFDGIDPSIFFDDDGRVYITSNGAPPYEPLYAGHRAIWIQEFDLQVQETIGPRQMIVDGGVNIEEEPVWIEAPHQLKKDGLYYLIAAEGGTEFNHSEVVFRSEAPMGPYAPYVYNPILTQRHLDADRPFPVTSSGHADFVELPNGDWWAVFLATRPYANDYYNTGRETFMLPVEWTDDGWPVVVGGTEAIPFVHERPDLPIQPKPALPTNGNFTLRDDFEGETLAPYWNFIRTPHDAWHRLQDGELLIQSRHVPLGSLGHPAFIGRRQQHLRATVTTAMRYAPHAAGDKAGLAAFQNARHYYLMSVALRDGQIVVQLEKAAGSDPTLISTAPIEGDTAKVVYLRIEAEASDYRFSYALEPDAWTMLQHETDGTILSTHVAGGFVGTYFGLYGYATASASAAYRR